MPQFGASFSIKYCRDLKLEPRTVLEAALNDLGVRRLRLMSYWDVHQPEAGRYDFSELDWQFEMALHYKAEVSLAIGLRQPRWPEVHQPEWAKRLPKNAWRKALCQYIETVVKRYRNHPALVSWQLENEALNRGFGVDGEYDRSRLRHEFRLVKSFDPNHPIIMSTSNAWGVPIRRPRPDIVGFSIYRVMHLSGNYTWSKLPPFFHFLRAVFIRMIMRRSVFIHELQTEPWGPGSTQDLPLSEQFKSMDLQQFHSTVRYALRTRLNPIDMWGLEWWYWLKTTHRHPELWDAARNVFLNRLEGRNGTSTRNKQENTTAV